MDAENVIQIQLESAISGAFVQISYDFEAANLAEFIKQVSEKLKTRKYTSSFVCPLMNLLARVNPVILILDFKIIDKMQYLFIETAFLYIEILGRKAA